ncbi:chaplin [Streptomyces sp. NPDC018038]|uniref:chaplin n=2 Tax=unclassified Streptomyces TaxID=2593676 RepID=UPI0037B26A15
MTSVMSLRPVPEGRPTPKGVGWFTCAAPPVGRRRSGGLVPPSGGGASIACRSLRRRAYVTGPSAEAARSGEPGGVSPVLRSGPVRGWGTVDACGDTVSVIGLLNPTFGNTCVNA